MKKQWLLGIVFLFFIVSFVRMVDADTGFKAPSVPSFSSSSSSTDGPIKAPLDHLDDFGSEASPSKVMDEAEKKKARADLDNYTSYMYVDDGKLLTPSMSAGMQTLFVRSQFFVTKTLYRFVSAVVHKLNSEGLVTQWTGQLFSTVQRMYRQFSSPSLYPLIAMGVISSLIFYWLKRRFFEGVRRVIMVFLLTGLFIFGGQKLVTQVNDALTGVSNALIQTVKISGVSATNVNDLRKTMVEVPFLYLNFDHVEIQSDGSSNIPEKDILRVLTCDDDNDTLKQIQSDLKDQHLTSKKLGEKFLTALASVINALLVGFIYLTFTIFAFVMRVLLLVLLLLLPFVAIFSLFPFLDQWLLNWGKAVGETLILSNVVVIGTAMLCLLDGLVSSMVTSMIGSDYFFITLTKMIVYVLLFKFRHKIAAIFKAGKLATSPFASRLDGLLKQARQKGTAMAVKPFLTASSAGVVAGLTAGQMLAGQAKAKAKQGLTGGTGSLWHGGLSQRADRVMKQVDQVDPSSKKGQKLLAKEERLKQRLERRKQHFENPNALQRKVAAYRKAYQQRRNAKDPSLARQTRRIEKQRQAKVAAIQSLYQARQKALQARAIERRFHQVVPEEQKVSMTTLANREKLRKRSMKQAAMKSAHRMQEKAANVQAFGHGPTYPWD